MTGATGFVGRHLVAALLARGCSVRAVARNAELAASLPWIDDVEFIAQDIHAPDIEIASLMKGVDVLAHLAWPGLPNYQALFHLEHNLMADYRFIKSAVLAGVPQVMVTGTCLEYGMQSGPLCEARPADPTTPYGLAKHSLRLFLEALQVHSPFTLQWARLFYLHGDGQNPGSLLAALERSITEGHGVFAMSGGEQLRDYLPVTTAADYLAALVVDVDVSATVNCSSGEPVSVRGLAEEYVRNRGSSIRLNLGQFPYSAHEPMAFWGVNERLKQLLNAEPH